MNRHEFKDDNNPEWETWHSVNHCHTLQSLVTDQLSHLKTPQIGALKTLILSPNYHVKKNHYDAKCLGCCGEFFEGFKCMKSDGKSMIKFSITNGMIFGKPPGALAKLNDVELALITLTRVRSHVFSYVAGQPMQVSASIAHRRIVSAIGFYLNTILCAFFLKLYFVENCLERSRGNLRTASCKSCSNITKHKTLCLIHESSLRLRWKHNRSLSI